jgi:RNA polymerase sigma-70 factor (ECF subfamily)
MKSELDEKLLVNAVLSADRKAFEQLIRNYEGLVIHIVGTLIKNEQDREDLCQDVFMKVYEKLNGFQFRSKLSTWIGNIAYNASINFLQKKRAVFLDDLLGSDQNEEFNNYERISKVDDDQTPETMLIQKDVSRLLDQVVESLPKIQKTILLLFHQDEISLEEISMIMEMPVNTVKSHLFRARTRLKEILVQQKIEVR